MLSIDHVQGDPFAAPSRLHIQVAGRAVRIPKELYDSKHKKTAVADYLLRNFAKQLERHSFQAHGSGKSGIIQVTRCGQEVLERTACEIDEKTGDVTVRFEVGFPARGRTIQAGELVKILYQYLPACVEKALYYKNMDRNAVKQAAELSVDQEYIREQLKKEGLVAFVADGSILPRESGVSQRPMKDAVPFASPDSMRITMKLPYKGMLTGMGIRKGVTLIVGGGYHGKSTLLKALESGVYPHVAGDGREYVVTDDTAMKIRAEDGRSIRHTDISMFINDLPNQKNTHVFQQRMPVEVRLRLPALLREWKPEAKFFFWMKILLPPTSWCGIRSCRKSSPVKRNRSLHFSNGHRSCIQLPEFLRFWLPEVPVHFSTLQTQLSRWTAIVLWISHAKSKKSVENIL